MTDQDRFFKLMADFGIEPVIETPNDGGLIYALEGNRGGVGGTPGVCCLFGFDADGKFRDVNVWDD